MKQWKHYNEFKKVLNEEGLMSVIKYDWERHLNQ